MQTSAQEAFRLDHNKFRGYLARDYDEPMGLDTFAEGGLAGSLSGRVYDAYECSAIIGPQNVELQTYALNDALLICVREHDHPAGVPLRQIAGYSTELKHLVSHEGSGFAECCSAIEEVLRHATRLLPSLRASGRQTRGFPSASTATSIRVTDHTGYKPI
jgi:hypothetical protein